ncbi:inositol monophosphatase family protein [Paenibacillus sp. DMB20]|uniref:inositol monophosphatase family protein n=1 Tax=Paenibacillus sp. DMB20 TaxID=1642570 RepID=UPI00069B31FD|nr:inositol monophosphatase family protein [Paenibacillus sp. DMB20]
MHKRKKLSDTILATTPPSFPGKDTEQTRLTLNALSQVLPKAFAVRMLGSVSLQLAYAACGRVDGYYEYGSELYNWMAGSLLVKEAGGVVTDVSGERFGWGTSGIIAANAGIHRRISEQLHSIQ